jgi:REP element-mobilizing transposase RayT
MSRNYKFHNPEGLYFVSFAVINWIDVFTRNEYKDTFLDTVRYTMEHGKMSIFSWCIMTNHVHLIFNVPKPFKPELVLGDIKRFSSKRLIEAIKANPRESRKEWMIQQFQTAADHTSNTTQYQFWRHDNHPTELWSDAVIREKIRYIHNNPVEAGLVAYPKDYLYSSAMDYAGEKGLLKGIEVLDQMYDWKRI